MLTVSGIQFVEENDYSSYLEANIQSCKNSDILVVWSSGIYLHSKDYYTLLENFIHIKTHLNHFILCNQKNIDILIFSKIKKF